MTFDPSAAEYFQAMERVEQRGATDGRFTRGSTIRQKMDQVQVPVLRFNRHMLRPLTRPYSCSSYVLADFYFPQIVDYMRGDQLGGEWQSYIHDPASFDYDSIMIYSSFLNSRNPGHPRLGWVLQRHTPGHPRQGRATDIWQGGAENPADRRPSAKDAERVVAMYPIR